MRYVYLILTLLYVLSPYDIIPDIVFGLGWLDDIIVLFFLVKYLFRLKTEFKNYFNNYKFKDLNKSFIILGVKPNSSPKEIRAAYINLASKYHPDKFLHLGTEKYKIAEAKFIKIKEAYDNLKILGKV